eukprot:486541_1
MQEARNKQIDNNSDSSEDSILNNLVVREFKWYQNPINWIRIILALVLTSLLIFAICKPKFAFDRLTSFLEWVENNPWYGTLAFMLTYILTTVFMITGSILCFGGGFIYSRVLGFWLGICYATFILTISCFIASCIAFIIGRFALRDAFLYSIRNKPKFKLIDKAVELHGFTVVFLIRLSPVTIYWLFNYIAGALSITFKHYCLGAIGMIPNVFVYVYIGASINNIYQISTMDVVNSEVIFILTIVGAVLLIIAMLYFAYIARNKLREIEQEISRQSISSITSIDEDEYHSNDDLL